MSNSFNGTKKTQYGSDFGERKDSEKRVGGKGREKKREEEGGFPLPLDTLSFQNSFSVRTLSVKELILFQRKEEEDMKRSLVTSVQSSVFNREKGWREYRCSTGTVSRSKDWKGLTGEGLF